MQGALPPIAKRFNETKPFVLFFLLLAMVYGAWQLVFWPGVLGEDSLSILLEIENPESHRSGKPAFWFYFVRLFYQGDHLVEAPIAAMLLLSAVMLARILAWCWAAKLYKTVFFSLLFICTAPHLIFFAGSLYPDGFYSIAVAALLFEVWLVARTRTATLRSLFAVALALPVATFARPNGVIFLIPVSLLVLMVDRVSRRHLAILVLVWCAVMAAGSSLHKSPGHGALYPLAIFETVNFLQPRPMKLWTAQPIVSTITVETLKKHYPLDGYRRYYDPDYWDPLQFYPQGPRVMSFPAEDRALITEEFLRYNVWHNIPLFLGSRVNLFLVSALAKGGFPSFDYARHVLKKLDAQTDYRQFHLTRLERALKAVHDFSYRNRWLLWTPFLGIGLLVWALWRGAITRDKAMLLVSLPMLVQFGGIFLLSTAGEYRYLLPFFTLPLVLLPMFALRNQRCAAQGIAP